MSIEEKRQQIDSLDNQIIKLLNQRFSLTDEIGQLKKEKKLSVEQAGREQIIYDKIKRQSIYADELVQIYEKIMSLSKQRQQNI